MIRAVLFDATGTLIRLRQPLGETYSRAALAQGVEISAWRIEDAFRRVFAQSPPMVFPGAAPEERAALERNWWRGVVRATFLAADSSRRLPDERACFETLWAHFSDAAAWEPRPGATDLLDALRSRGLRTAVVSNFDARLPGILAGLGLAERLDAIVLPATAGAAKPAAAIFAFALERLGLDPEEALFIGDDAPRDLEAARRVGMRAVDVASLATLDALPIPGSEDA